MSPADLLFLVGAAVFAVTGVLGAVRQDMDVLCIGTRHDHNRARTTRRHPLQLGIS